MKLLSVNVSQPIEVEYNNTRIWTSIFKKPVDGNIDVARFNLEGDQQVDLENHGGGHKAVYGFSAEQYEYWRSELGRPELHYGQFGENLTIENFDESSLCIGDQLKISDCILEITQPRVPCFKLGIAFALNTMPKLFIQHGHTGIYFKVLQAGTIKAGDQVERIYQHPKKLAVKTLFNAYFDDDFVDADKVMKLASEIHQLSDEWREKVIARL
ncbi:MAG: MOSC domain-containing protein [Gammaproteobacteria bacterium]|nr:MOSC domain-containing protein [Gammaproteobacteria bacterium]